MEIQFFDSTKEMFETIHKAREAADAKVKPWQAQIKPGDCFVSANDLGTEIITIYGQVIESPNPQERALFTQHHMRHFRLARCFSEACPEGEIGDIHVSTLLSIIDLETFELARLTGWPSLVERRVP